MCLCYKNICMREKKRKEGIYWFLQNDLRTCRFILFYWKLLLNDLSEGKSHCKAGWAWEFNVYYYVCHDTNKCVQYYTYLQPLERSIADGLVNLLPYTNVSKKSDQNITLELHSLFIQEANKSLLKIRHWKLSETHINIYN